MEEERIEEITEEEVKERITPESIKEQFDLHLNKAKYMLKDDEKMEGFFQKLERKMVQFPGIGGALADVPIFASLVRAYVKKKYTQVPTGTVLAALAALIYFVNPLDIVPDAIPILGQIDDAALLAFSAKMVHDDINEYREWQKEEGIREE